MKAQMFLLTAAIVIGLLVSLKAYTNIQEITTEKDILDASQESSMFSNIIKETTQATSFSVLNSSVISDNSIDFINFTRNGTMRQGDSFRGIFVGAKANSTNQTMNITVLSFLGEQSVNFTIKLNNGTIITNSTTLNDSNIWNNNFTFAAGGTYNLTVDLPDKNYEQNITVKTKNNQDVYVGFYDFNLTTIRAVHRNIFQESFKIN